MKRFSKDRYVIIYPQYFDLKLSRKNGRRAPKSLAVSSPSLIRIKEACDKLGFKAMIESDKNYPRMSNTKSGRVIVFYDSLSKRRLIREIGKILKGVSN